MSQEVFNSWSFNALNLSKNQRINLAVYIVCKFHEDGDGFVNTGDEAERSRDSERLERRREVGMFQRFTTAVEKEYLHKS